jgi:predicted nucleotidyltransferase
MLQTFEQIKSLLNNYDSIRMAMIFGSRVSGKDSSLSDIDIAVYSDPTFELIEFGKLISKLEAITICKVDLIELNGLNNSNNLLTYEIVSNHHLLFSNDQELFIDFKRNTFLTYFDQEYMRSLFNTNLLNRINTDMFGKRLNA